MRVHPNSFEDWQTYPSTLDHIHVAWLKQVKKSRTDFSETKKIALVND